MTYQEAVDYLNEQKSQIIRPGLEAVSGLLALLGDPQDNMKYIHIAGTNGKGSTAAYMESILRAAGYKTGLFTSPYIESFSEKIRFNNQIMREDILIQLTEKVKAAADRLSRRDLYPTPFELQTAVAFLFFQMMECDIVVLETGLGGRLDATNVIKEAEVSVICSISYDHMDYLGNTLTEIAGEKAGIIKPHGRVVCYPQKEVAGEVIKRRCREMDSELFLLDEKDVILVSGDRYGQIFRVGEHEPFTIHMLGGHQVYNATLAVMAIDILNRRGYRISEKDIACGLAQTRWQGRMEIIREEPAVIMDGAHNADGARVLAKGLKELFPGKKITFITGILRDKEYEKMLDQVIPMAEAFYTVTPDNPRALSAEELAKVIEDKGVRAYACPTVKEAVGQCMKLGRDSIICAFGSLYYIGQIKKEVVTHV